MKRKTGRPGRLVPKSWPSGRYSRSQGGLTARAAGVKSGSARGQASATSPTIPASSKACAAGGQRSSGHRRYHQPALGQEHLRRGNMAVPREVSADGLFGRLNIGGGRPARHGSVVPPAPRGRNCHPGTGCAGSCVAGTARYALLRCSGRSNRLVASGSSCCWRK